MPWRERKDAPGAYPRGNRLIVIRLRIVGNGEILAQRCGRALRLSTLGLRQRFCGICRISRQVAGFILHRRQLYLIFQRIALDLGNEYYRANLNMIAGFYHRFLYAVPVVEGAIGTAQVLKAQATGCHDEPAVLPGYFRQRYAKVTILPAANDSDIALERKPTTLTVGREHEQRHLHKRASIQRALSCPPNTVWRIN